MLCIFLFQRTMPRIYKRKSNKGQISFDLMKSAVDAVNGGKSVRSVATQY